MPPEPAAAPVDDERKRARLATALFGFVAAVQVFDIVISPKDPVNLLWRFALLVPAALFAWLWWRGRRPRIVPIVYASLWSAINATSAVMIVLYNPDIAEVRWFIPLFVASSITFTAVTIVIVTGRPSRARRIAGAALGAVFALVFLTEHLFQVL